MIWTLAVILFCMAVGGSLIWYERRPLVLGEPRMIPSTMLLAITVLILILALAHLVSLVTGVPLKGRMGFGR